MKSKVRRGIGLVAHDAMKKDLIEWVLWNSELLMGNKFYCTGTTGTLILEALKEKHPDEEWDFTILKSGPLGGDQQMGSRIVDGQIDYLFFFTDPMTLQPHDTDYFINIVLSAFRHLCFISSCDYLISCCSVAQFLQTLYLLPSVGFVWKAGVRFLQCKGIGQRVFV